MLAYMLKYVNIIMSLVDINNSHVIMIMLHPEIVYLACSGLACATVVALYLK